MSFWITLISGVIVTAGTGVALGAALGLTGLFILQFYSNGATSVAIDAIWNVFNSFTLSAVPMPRTWSLPQSLHFSQLTQSLPGPATAIFGC